MSANEKMVMVPRELLSRVVRTGFSRKDENEIMDILDQPAQQGQGEGEGEGEGEPDDINDIRDAIIAKGELERRIAEMGALPRLDYWYQAIFAADARIGDAIRARRARLYAGNGADQCNNSTVATVEIDELRAAVIARRDLDRRIQEMGIPPHMDYWNQAIFDADARIDAALERKS